MSNSAVATEWQVMPPNTYRIMAWLIPETEGGYSVVGINLPGCCTQGETMQEAFDNLKDAAKELIASYLEDGKEIPWSRELPPRPTTDTRRVSVFVTVE